MFVQPLFENQFVTASPSFLKIEVKKENPKEIVEKTTNKSEAKIAPKK
jgi:hypothetical protein